MAIVGRATLPAAAAVAVLLLAPAFAVGLGAPAPAALLASTTGSPRCDLAVLVPDLDGCREWEATLRGSGGHHSPAFGFVVEDPPLLLVVGRDGGGSSMGDVTAVVVAYETEDNLSPFQEEDGAPSFIARFASANGSVARDVTRIADAVLSPDGKGLAVAATTLMGTFRCSDGRDPPQFFDCYDHGTLVTVLRTASGERPWTFVRGSVDPTWNTPDGLAYSADGSRLYVAVDERPLGGPRTLTTLALDAATGDVVWTSSHADKSPRALLVAGDGRILVSTTSTTGGPDSVLSLDPAGGALLGEHPLPITSTTSAVGLHRTASGFLHVAGSTVTGLHPDLAVAWQRTFGADTATLCCATPPPEVALAPDGAVAYAIDHGADDAVVAFDVASGGDVWRWAAPWDTDLNGIHADASGVRVAGDSLPRDQDTARVSSSYDASVERPVVFQNGNRGRDLFIAALSEEGSIRWAAYDDPGFVHHLRARGVVAGDGRTFGFAQAYDSSGYRWYVAAHADRGEDEPIG